ncbi:MAG: hypothetical protein IT443_12175 [Phycisphaeraceae bacterium]|nr:hypothetical protein [Phycisphaeraceae bacterium]
MNRFPSAPGSAGGYVRGYVRVYSSPFSGRSKIAASLFALLLSALLLPACHSSSPESYLNDNDRLRSENLHLQQQIDQLNEDIEIRLHEIQTLVQKASATQPAVDPSAIPAAALVRFDRLSAFHDTDNDKQPDRLRLYVKIFDQKKRFLPAVGSAVVQVVAIQPEKPPVTLAEKTFSPSQFDAAYRSSLAGTHYTLELDLPANLPHDLQQATVKLTFTDSATGVQLEHERPLPLFPPAKPTK